MEQSSFFRTTGSSEGFFKDRGSKFYGFSYPVRSTEEVDEILKELKKKYYDARHHCFAYRLGKEAEIEFATDDGEPSHSAGDPILGVLRATQLTWTLIVVVRYFGGTKLGIRGLIEAYRAAAEDALGQETIEEIIPKTLFTLNYTYDKTSLVNKLLHPFPIEVVEASYTDTCSQSMQIRRKRFPELKDRLEKAGFSLENIEESE